MASPDGLNSLQRLALLQAQSSWHCLECLSANPTSVKKCGSCEAPNPAEYPRNLHPAWIGPHLTKHSVNVVHRIHPGAFDLEPSAKSSSSIAELFRTESTGSSSFSLSQSSTGFAAPTFSFKKSDSLVSTGGFRPSSFTSQSSSSSSSFSSQTGFQFQPSKSQSISSSMPFTGGFSFNPTRSESKLDDDSDEKMKICEDDLSTSGEDYSKLLTESKKMKQCDTRLYSCGMGGFGSLGLGDDELNEERPKLVPESKRVNFEKIVCGSFLTIAIDAKGRIWSWGPDDDGGLGRTGAEFSPEIVQIPNNPASKNPAVEVSVGDVHVTALLRDGQVYSWGSFKSDGRVGHHVDLDTNEVVKIQKTPFKMSFPTKYPIVGVASGINHCVGLDSNGSIFMFGITKLGERTSSRFLHRQLSPTRVFSKPFSAKFRSVSCGAHNIFAIDQTGHVYAMGQNNYGQLGNPREKRAVNNVLSRVRFPNEFKAAEVSAGTHHVLCLSEDGSVYSWGRNASGLLGRKTKSGEAEYANVVPEMLPSSTPTYFCNNCSKIRCGDDHNLLLISGGLYGFGFPSDFRIGNGSETPIPVGTRPLVFSPENLKNASMAVHDFDAGSQHSCFILRHSSRDGVKFISLSKPPKPVVPRKKSSTSVKNRSRKKSSVKTRSKKRKFDQKTERKSRPRKKR